MRKMFLVFFSFLLAGLSLDAQNRKESCGALDEIGAGGAVYYPAPILMDVQNKNSPAILEFCSMEMYPVRAVVGSEYDRGMLHNYYEREVSFKRWGG